MIPTQELISKDVRKKPDTTCKISNLYYKSQFSMVLKDIKKNVTKVQ